MSVLYDLCMQENRLQVSHLSSLCISSSMWVQVVSFEHSFHNCQALLKRTLYFQNPKMKLVLLIYSCWSCFVFLLMVVFFLTTFFMELCYVETLKQNLF